MHTVYLNTKGVSVCIAYKCPQPPKCISALPISAVLLNALGEYMNENLGGAGSCFKEHVGKSNCVDKDAVHGAEAY